MIVQNKFAWISLIILSLIWGSSFLLIKLGLLAFQPIQILIIRIGIAGLTLLPFLIYYLRKDERHPWPTFFIVGLVGNVIPAFCFALAQTVIPSSLAGMLNAIQPLFTILISIIAFKQHIPKHQIYGVITAFTGAILLINFSSSGIDSSNNIDYSKNISFSLLVVFATFCYGVATNIIRHHLHDQAPIKISAAALGIFMLPAAVLAWWTDIPHAILNHPQGLSAFYYIAALGAIGTAFALILFNNLIQSAGVVFASAVTYLIPIVAVLWGWIYQEPFSLWHLLSMTIIFVGLYSIHWKPRL